MVAGLPATCFPPGLVPTNSDASSAADRLAEVAESGLAAFRRALFEADFSDRCALDSSRPNAAALRPCSSHKFLITGTGAHDLVASDLADDRDG